MTLVILKYGSVILRKKSRIAQREDQIMSTIANLFETLAKYDGIGLAAPQTGILQQMFVINTKPLAENNPEIEIIKKAYVNPEILEWNDTISVYNEGCLSIPGIWEDVNRPEQVRVRYKDEQFNDIVAELSGIEARVFQHEFDHLNGILFTDRLSPIRKKLLRSKLNKIK
ncbi:MAG: peptide deformylase [Bacteroidales bacterium]|nr:peptide deformylase [Bacteroidales bacterium]